MQSSCCPVQSLCSCNADYYFRHLLAMKGLLISVWSESFGLIYNRKAYVTNLVVVEFERRRRSPDKGGSNRGHYQVTVWESGSRAFDAGPYEIFNLDLPFFDLLLLSPASI